MLGNDVSNRLLEIYAGKPEQFRGYDCGDFHINKYVFHNEIHSIPQHANWQGPILLTWFNFNPSMDKLSHAW